MQLKGRAGDVLEFAIAILLV